MVLSYQLTLWILSIFEYVYSHLSAFSVTYSFSFRFKIYFFGFLAADPPENVAKMVVVVHSIPQAMQKAIRQTKKHPWKRDLRSIPAYLRVWQTEPHRQQKATKNGLARFWVHLIKPIRLDLLPKKNKYALVFCRQSLACVQYGVDTMPGRLYTGVPDLEPGRFYAPVLRSIFGIITWHN